MGASKYSRNIVIWNCFLKTITNFNPNLGQKVVLKRKKSRKFKLNKKQFISKRANGI